MTAACHAPKREDANIRLGITIEEVRRVIGWDPKMALDFQQSEPPLPEELVAHRELQTGSAIPTVTIAVNRIQEVARSSTKELSQP